MLTSATGTKILKTYQKALIKFKVLYLRGFKTKIIKKLRFKSISEKAKVLMLFMKKFADQLRYNDGVSEVISIPIILVYSFCNEILLFQIISRNC